MRRLITLLLAVTVMLLGLVPAASADDGDPEGVGLHDPFTGLWYLLNADGSKTSFYFGNPGDFAVYGDWDCDGTDTPGLYRQSDGFVYLRNSNTQGIADVRFFFGNPGDEPLAGDFNNDGCDTISIWRPSENRVYIINKLGENDGGLGAADFSYSYGIPGDRPFVGDFDGDGVDTVGLYRPSSGNVFLRDSLSSGPPDTTFNYGGAGTDLPLASDWDGNGTDTIGVYQAPTIFTSSGGGLFLRNSNTAGNADFLIPFGEVGWRPIAGVFQAIDVDPPPPPEDPAPPPSGPALPPRNLPTVEDITSGRVSGSVILQGAVTARTNDRDEFIFSDATGTIRIELNQRTLDPNDVVLFVCTFIAGDARSNEIDVVAMVRCT